jgi:hypothetical protein
MADNTSQRFAVYNKTLLRYEGHEGVTLHPDKASADAAAKALREGKRKGHKLEVQEA